MAFIKLNHKAVQKEMIRAGLRAADLAKRLGVSRQMVNYIKNTGGISYAGRLARIFKCEKDTLIVSTIPKTRFVVVNNKVSRIKNQ